VNRRRHWEWWCSKEGGRKLLLVRELGLDEAGQVPVKYNFLLG
jgi:hypothetical protein